MRKQEAQREKERKEQEERRKNEEARSKGCMFAWYLGEVAWFIRLQERLGHEVVSTEPEGGRRDRSDMKEIKNVASSERYEYQVPKRKAAVLRVELENLLAMCMLIEVDPASVYTHISGSLQQSERTRQRKCKSDWVLMSKKESVALVVDLRNLPAMCTYFTVTRPILRRDPYTTEHVFFL
ncbi:hypothetical protein KCU62_g984, partial [Aureobasidium sp. EXF-3399]